MSEPPPLPEKLEYAMPPRRRSAQRMVGGLVTGSAISFLFWFVGWRALERSNFGVVLIWLIPLLKIVVGIVLGFTRDYSEFGTGLVVSIAIGILIFFGSCALHLTG